MPRHSRRKKRNRYSKGELNQLIDSLVHPLFNRRAAFMVADTILHGLVEKNPPETAVKSIRYSLPKIIGRITGQTRDEDVRVRKLRR